MNKSDFRTAFLFFIAAILSFSLFSCSHQQSVSSSGNGYAALNYSLQESVNNLSIYSKSVYETLASKNEINPGRARLWFDIANESRSISNMMIARLGLLKERLAVKAGGWSDSLKTNVKQGENTDDVKDWFIGKGIGKGLKDSIDVYVKKMNGLVRADSVFDWNAGKEVGIVPLKIINFSNQTSSQEISDGNTWTSYYFKGAPVIAAITQITKIQLDIKMAENQLANYCLNHIARRAIKVDQLVPVISPEKTIVEEGEKYKATFYMSAVDKSQEWQMIVNDKPINVQNCEGTYEMIASGLGTKKIDAYITLTDNDGATKHYPCSATYTVIPRKKK